jgi:hypothetical protein
MTKIHTLKNLFLKASAYEIVKHILALASQNFYSEHGKSGIFSDIKFTYKLKKIEILYC